MNQVAVSNSLPYSLELISELLKELVTPEGPFDPNGEWEHNYAYWVPLRGQAGKTWRAGSLKIARKKLPMGVQLEVKQVSGRNSKDEHLECLIGVNIDSLSTPTVWRMLWKILAPDGKTLNYTESWTRGRTEPGVVRILTEKETRHPVAGAVTGRWPIFDAVQRLPFKPQQFHFDFLEDMAVVKTGHRLQYVGEFDLELGGRKTTLHSFEHIGSGILPTTYWLDDCHRLLIVAGGLRAFVMESGRQVNS